MTNLLDKIGWLAGLAGALICLAAGLARVLGRHYVADHEISTLFLAGTALMAFACMVRLYYTNNKQ